MRHPGAREKSGRSPLIRVGGSAEVTLAPNSQSVTSQPSANDECLFTNDLAMGLP